LIREATISPCGRYRYRLVRSLGSNATTLFILNNCSMADATVDDPTVRKGWSYTLSWGYGRMIFCNTNPHRSTDPDTAMIPPDEILAENDTHLRFATAEADLVICAWGLKAKPELITRTLAAINCQKPLHVLELSKTGVPKHILYLKGNLQPMTWREASAGAAPAKEGQ
jgi:hypothetical protein